jgi:hypothetical protein
MAVPHTGSEPEYALLGCSWLHGGVATGTHLLIPFTVFVSSQANLVQIIWIYDLELHPRQSKLQSTLVKASRSVTT